jgi:hypothetical protein
MEEKEAYYKRRLEKFNTRSTAFYEKYEQVTE